MPAPNPAPYNPVFDFSARQVASPTTAYPAADLDAEFSTISGRLNGTQAALADIRASDGGMVNGVVDFDALDPATVRPLMGGWNPRGIWGAGVAYLVKDFITGPDGAAYVCAAAHTSGVFLTDKAAGKWSVLLVDGATAGSLPITATGSTTSRTLAARFAERKNVKDFGAVGDGVTNDTVAIQAAVDAVLAASGGGIVYFPPGRYKTNAAITIAQDAVTLAGDALGQNSIGSIIVGSGNHDVVSATGVSFFTIQDIGLAHPAGGLTAACSLLKLENCYYATVRHVSGRFYWHGITLLGSNQVSISDVELLNQQGSTGAAWGIGMMNSSIAATFGIKLNDVRLQGVNDTAGSVGLYGLGAGTVYASQLVVRNYDTAVYCGIDPLSLDRCVFWRLNQMEVETCNKGVDAPAITRFTAVACQVALSTAAAGAGFGWKFHTADAGDVTLIGCMAVNCTGPGYLIDGVGTSGTFVLTGCKASGNSVGSPGTYDGLLINASDNVTVTGGRYGGGGSSSVPGTMTQRNGIRVQGAGTVGISVVGANLEGNVSGAFVSGASVVPAVVGCPGLGDALSQVRSATNANKLEVVATETGFSPLLQATGSDAVLNLRLSPKSTGAVVMGGPVTLPVYTVAGLPAVGGSNLNAIVMCSNESGGRVPVFSDGVNWRRVTDRAIAS